MKSFKKYFSYHFKSSLLRTAIISLICLIVTVMGIDIVTKQQSNYTEAPSFNSDIYNIYSDIYVLMIILVALCMMIPILELGQFKSKRNLDTIYSLPISREKLALAHFINGFITIAITFTVCIIGAICRFIPYAEYFGIGYFIPYYFLSLLAALFAYSVLAFLFMQANTVADGVVFEIIYTFIFVVVGYAIQMLFGIERGTFDAYNLSIYSPVSKIYTIFNDLISKSEYETPIYIDEIISFIIWGALGIASFFGYIFTFKNQKVEKIGGISDSWFGYKVIVPVLGIASIIGEAYVPYIIILPIGYIIYRRSVKFKKSDLIIMACACVFMVLCLIF